MTPMSNFQASRLADGINGLTASSSISTSPYRADLAALDLAERMKMLSETAHEAAENPFTYYQAFVNTSLNFGGNTKELAPINDGYTGHIEVLGAQGNQVNVGQQHASGHSIPYNLAVRLANRSNGAPLATIVEQGSYSTLNSRGSLFSVGRFPSLKTGENVSPSHASHRKSRSLDEIMLQNVREGVDQDKNIHRVTGVHVKPCGDGGNPGRMSASFAPVTPPLDRAIQIQQSQSEGSRDVADIGGPKGFLRTVLQNVRSASRTRARSRSSASGERVVNGRQGRHQQAFQPPYTGIDVHGASTLSNALEPRVFANDDGPLLAASVPQARTRKTSGTVASGPSAHTAPPPLLPGGSIRNAESTLASEPQCRLLPPAAVTRSRERCSFVFPEPRDAALSSRPAEARTVSNTNTALSSARHTFDSSSVLREHASSLKTPSFVRDTSRNASRCSTLSTSYSGTVLGIDLDLQSDHALASCASRSSTPVWFTPQLAELELQASCSESSGTQPSPENILSQRSVTSSALTSLLPIAVASGIVRPNYDTPKISFFSPSGNLIQPEESPVQSSTPSSHSGSPPPRPTYCNRSSICDPFYQTTYPLTRPAPIPMTTPPTPKVPLPVQLQHHHNFQHPEMSQISSCESLILPTTTIKGCGGIVQNQSLTPRSSVPHVSGKQKLARGKTSWRTAKWTIRDMRSEARFLRSRFIATARRPAHKPSIQRRLKRQGLREKNHTHHRRYSARGGLRSKSKLSSATRSSKGNVHTPRHEDLSTNALAPLAAHVLRICFCQPYDEAGISTSTRAPGISLRRSTSTVMIGRPDRESLLGTRLVNMQRKSRANFSAAGRSAQRSRSDSHTAVKVRAHERSYRGTGTR